MNNVKHRTEIENFVFVTYLLAIVLIAHLLILFGSGSFTSTSSLAAVTAGAFAGFGINVTRLFRCQQRQIEVLEEKLLRVSVPSPFAHATPMTNDQ
jgi:hypothetical protein